MTILLINDIDNKARELELAKNHDQAMKFEKQLLEQKLEAAIKTKELSESRKVQCAYQS